MNDRMNDITSTLEAARDLIADPERWTQSFMARDKTGHCCETCASDAVSWCSVGAIWKVNPIRVTDAFVVLREFTGESISRFNDTHTHAEVIAAFDRAIERSKEEA